MIKKYGPTIKKLQRAINGKSEDKILVNKTQMYSESSSIITEVIYIKKAIRNKETGRNRYEELFHSTSDVQIVLFLRDYWYELNGWEVPTDNEEWTQIKQKFLEKQEAKKNESKSRSYKRWQNFI